MNDSWKATGLKLLPLVERKRFGIYGGGGMGLGYYEPVDEVFVTLALDIGSYITIGSGFIDKF